MAAGDYTGMPTPRIPPPKECRSHRFTIHLDSEGAERLRSLAESRGEPPGRLATLIVEDGTRQLVEGVTSSHPLYVVEALGQPDGAHGTRDNSANEGRRKSLYRL